MKLYIYDHCPFCVKARMIFGLQDVPVELVILLNDDVETPTRLVGKKMVPILQKADGSNMPESMDIVRYIDHLNGAPLLTGERNPALMQWLRKVDAYINALLLPHIAEAPFAEFATPAARAYFKAKKEASVGNFDELKKKTPELIKKIGQDLLLLDALIASNGAVNGTLSDDDIHLFPLLRALTLIAGVKYPTRVTEYRDTMAKQTGINLLTSIGG